MYLGYRIIAGATPRVAAKYAFDTKPSALENAVLHYRLDHILAAGRRITAGGRREGRDARSVEVHRQKEYVADNSTHGCKDQPNLADVLTGGVTLSDVWVEATILAMSLLMARSICA